MPTLPFALLNLSLLRAVTILPVTIMPIPDAGRTKHYRLRHREDPRDAQPFRRAINTDRLWMLIINGIMLTPLAEDIHLRITVSIYIHCLLLG